MIRFGIASVVVLGCLLWGYTHWRSAALGAAYPRAGAFVELEGGARLHYTERTPAAAPKATVVLLHGASGNQADMMVPLGARLAAAGFRVVAFDRPGHGWSDRPDGAADAGTDRQATMLCDAMRRMGIDHAIMVGHSWSGALAANMALDHRDVVQGLVLLAPVLYPWPGGVAWYYAPAAAAWIGPLFTHTLTLPVGEALMPAGIAEVFAPQPSPADFAARTGIALVLRPADFTANAQDVMQLLDFVRRQEPRMPSIDVPTEIVAGDGDRIVSTEIHAARAAREVPGAALTILHGVGHSPHWVDPDAVVRAVERVADRSARAAVATRP